MWILEKITAINAQIHVSLLNEWELDWRLSFMSCHNTGMEETRTRQSNETNSDSSDNKTVICFTVGRYFAFLSPVCQENFWHIPTTSSIFVDSRIFFKHLCQIFFHWILLHNTNQDQKHSCGCSYIQHIQLQQSWASKSTASPLLSQQMANHGFVGMQWYTRMSVQLLCTSWKYETNWTETSYRWLAVLLNRGYSSVTRTKCLSSSLSAD